jgi:hypothetical protein
VEIQIQPDSLDSNRERIRKMSDDEPEPETTRAVWVSTFSGTQAMLVTSRDWFATQSK